jgi:hypothetical protein
MIAMVSGARITRRAVIGGGVAVLVLLVSGIVVVRIRTSTGGAGEEPTTVQVSWDVARTSPDGRELLFVFTGAAPYRDDDPCSADYTVDVAETGERVVAEIIERMPNRDNQPDLTCDAVGYGRTARTALAQPLASRPLIDGHTGQPHPPFNGAALLEPSTLPAGWKLQNENGADTVHGPAWVRSYGPDGATAQGASVRQGPPEMLLSYLGESFYKTQGHRTVHGIDATLYIQPSDANVLILAWAEHGQGISVWGRLNADELVTFASGLRN